MCYPGITRDVRLVKVTPVYLEDYSLQLEKADAKAKNRLIRFSAKLNKQEAGHKVTVSIPELKIKQTFTTDAEGKVQCSMINVQSKKLQLWSPENPKRYQVQLTLGGRGEACTIADEIGFRTIEARGKQILLNGQPVFLKGISIHEEKSNGGGRANSTEDAHALLSWAKELGCNFVRLAHYPHNENMVREAERMGLMVWSEIPCYWTIAWKNPATYDNARQQLTDMVRRDHNRANIIIWSIANETPHSKERDTFRSFIQGHTVRVWSHVAVHIGLALSREVVLRCVNGDEYPVFNTTSRLLRTEGEHFVVFLAEIGELARAGIHPPYLLLVARDFA